MLPGEGGQGFIADQAGVPGQAFIVQTMSRFLLMMGADARFVETFAAIQANLRPTTQAIENLTETMNNINIAYQGAGRELQPEAPPQ